MPEKSRTKRAYFLAACCLCLRDFILALITSICRLLYVPSWVTACICLQQPCEAGGGSPARRRLEEVKRDPCKVVAGDLQSQGSPGAPICTLPCPVKEALCHVARPCLPQLRVRCPAEEDEFETALLSTISPEVSDQSGGHWGPRVNMAASFPGYHHCYPNGLWSFSEKWASGRGPGRV